METGPCIEGDCIGALSCLSDLCVDPDPDAVTGGHAGEDTDGDPTGRDDDGDPPVPFDNEIDIIFMIDDSGSMAEEQLALVGAIEKLVERLESPAVNANYRIAFTTSDNGNPLCPTNFKTPEGGKFVLSSCRQRASHFTFSTVPPVEAFNAVCASPCAHETIEVLPTPTHLDDTSRPRPWIERNNTISNLPPNISTVEAVRCLAPMGIAGCGYEEQLESVYKAILRTQSAGEDQYGFIRPNAMLAIVLVSDEADGSYNRVPYGNFGPYDPNGNRVFWQDESAPAPSSAVSWNAGVQCTGSGSPYDDCYSQHYDIDGNVVSPQQAASQAVLHPVSRYIGLIEEIAEAKRQLQPNREVVVVAGLLGVPPGYSGDMIFRDDPSDPQFTSDFGIGPACVSELSLPGQPAFQPKAVPSVRQRELVEHFERAGIRNVFSICQPDFSGPIDRIVDSL